MVVGAAVKARGACARCRGCGASLLECHRHRGVGRSLASSAASTSSRGVAFAKRRLLWRVRRKLIISYIFIGFVPAILIVAFFLLGGLLLFSNFSSYLVQSRLHAGRSGVPLAHARGDRDAAAAADGVAVLHAAGRDGAASSRRCRWRSFRLDPPAEGAATAPARRPVRRQRTCAGPRAGRGRTPSRRPIPGVDHCSGFRGAPGRSTTRRIAAASDAQPHRRAAGAHRALVRARRVSRGADPYAVVVDLPVDAASWSLRSETGVELTGRRQSRRVAADTARRDAGGLADAAAARDRPAADLGGVSGLVDWPTGDRSSLSRQHPYQRRRYLQSHLGRRQGGARQTSARACCSCCS